MHEYYATRAPYYDAVYLKPEREADISFLSDHLPDRFRGREVLEIACGTGYWTQYIAPVTTRMVATDRNMEPLEIAKNRVGIDSVVFSQADAYSLPKTFGSFNGSFAGLWFSHIPIELRRDFLEGLHNLLLLNANVIFLDNNEVQLTDFPITDTDEKGNTYQTRGLRDGSKYRVLKNFPTELELRELLEPVAKNIVYLNLDNFWIIEYEVFR